MSIATHHRPLDGEAPPPPFLTVAAFHDHFRSWIGINTIYELVRSERIRSIKLGERKILIPASELIEWPQRELETTS